MTPAIACVLLFLPLSGASPPVADGESEFQAALDLVQRRMDSSKWKEARTLLDESLAAHQGKDYVLGRLALVQGCFQRIAFGSTHPRKEAKDVLHGEVLDWDARKSEIRLRYRREDAVRWPQPDEPIRAGRKRPSFPLGDFAEEGEYLVLAVPFDGPHQVQFRGSAVGDTNPRILVCLGDQGSYRMTYDASEASTIVHVTKDGEDTLAYNGKFFNVRRPYKLKASVFQKNMTLAYDGAKLLDAPKPPTTWGRLGYRTISNLEEILVTGQVQAGWIEKRIQEATDKEWAEFIGGYDVKADLPGWLRPK